jgi:L-seryl-tRNA(Ser) seleniumtransferase
MSNLRSVQAALPSVDRVLKDPALAALIEEYGRPAVVAALRDEVDRLRATLTERGREALQETRLEHIAARLSARLRSASLASLKPVFNLTGILLHSNLGRASLPEAAVQAICLAACKPVNLEFDLGSGRRGDRDRHLEPLLVGLTGAERATVVNNNAAAVLLVLNTLGLRRSVLLSRGELIEIGGEFRMPEIMKRAGCRLVEVGTTNRTHPGRARAPTRLAFAFRSGFRHAGRSASMGAAPRADAV